MGTLPGQVDCRVLGSGVGGSQPFPVRLCWLPVKGGVGEWVWEPVRCLHCWSDVPCPEE